MYSAEVRSGIAPGIEMSRALGDIRGPERSREVRGPFDLEVKAGEFFSVVGPDGCGTNTAIRMIAGLVPLESGEITVGGEKVESPRTDIGVAYAEPSLMEWRTALENIMLQAEIRRLDRRKFSEQARRLMVLLGVDGCEHLKPHQLTESQRVRVSLCRAPLPGPSALLLHDPFRRLDPLSREQIVIDLQRLMLTPRITVVLATTHIMEAVQLSDRVGVMSVGGSILQYLTIELPRPRRQDKATAPQLMEYCSVIRTSLQAQGVLR